MSAPGRGRGESSNMGDIDKVDPRTEQDRLAQLEAARLSGLSESEIPIRGRGGFRQAELRTIPENITELRSKNPTNVRQVDIMTNYVRIFPMQGRIINSYRVDYEPEVEDTKLMGKLFGVAGERVFTTKSIFDGVHECRNPQKLADKITRVDVVLPDNDKKQYVVVITHTGTVGFGAEMMRTYNSHMRMFLGKLGFYQPQPGLYVNPEHTIPVGQDIMMLRGYQTSANLHDENKMLMNLNAAHKIIQRANVLQYMTGIRDRARGANLQEAIRAELVGKLVVTSYKKVCYRIEDVDFKSNPDSTFNRKGVEVSFADYFKDMYQLNILDRKQPLLVVVLNNLRRREEEAGGDKPQQKLIPELCNIAGLTEPQRTDNRLKMDLIRASQIAPTHRVEHLKKFLADFHNNQDIKAHLSAWGYSYDNEPLKLKAHTHGATKIGTGGAGTRPSDSWPVSNSDTADFEVRSLAVSAPIPKLAILVPGRLPPNMPKGQCLEVLKKGFDRVGLYATNAQPIDIDGDSPAAYISAIRNLPPDVTAAIVIMTYQNKEKYDSIKKAASVERGLITQVVTAKLLCDPKKSGGAQTKIAIQIAAKVGGEPWWVDLPLRCSMVCGYDTYHDTAQRGRSYGAFLASMNDKYSKWYSKADAHDRLEEMSSQVATNMQQALNNYKRLNGQFPERVFIYRDGVGEGQVEHVYRVELQRIQEVVKACGANIRLTMIIVNKRIGARFYMRANEGFANPPPGTVIDHGVTRQERYDFYLISQSTRHGTVTPTYYHIIHDESGFKPDIHQKMAFKMCLLYYNWTGSVRVPAPCQYAHKLALLCGEHLHGQPNANLDNKLHFL